MPSKAKAPSPASPLLTSSARQKRFRTKLHAWFQNSGRDLPWRRTRDPYAIMVSELMLQQTQVATVIPYFERWLARFPDFGTLAAAREDEVLAQWQGLGYYSRARNLHRAAQLVVAQHGGALPADLAEIARLPGVGRYTAGAIASFAFDRPVATIDANIARVLARVLALREPIDSRPGRDVLWHAAEALLPPRGGGLHTSALMELGALLCTPARPRCLLCPVREFCAADDPESLPVKKPRPRTVELREECAWIIHDDRVLLERQTGSRWRGLWKLPLLATRPADRAGPLVQLDYPFTHHRVTLAVFAQPAPAAAGPAQQWFARAELETIAIPSPHRRALLRLLDHPSARSQRLA